MLSVVTDGEGNTTISFDTHFRVESDWLTVDGGIFTFADVLTVNISAAELVVCSRHKFDSAHIGFHGRDPIEQPTLTGSRGGNQALAALLAHLHDRGDIVDNTTA